MILDLDAIRKIYDENPNKDILKYKKEKSDVYKANVTGIGAKELIKRISTFERESVAKVRREMMLSNKDIIHRVLLPREKIYSAKGGVEIYNLKSPEYVDQFKEYLANITGQSSLKEFVRDILQKRLDYDPEGLKWVEVNADGIPYPAFKSIQSIFEWQLNGRRLDYVFFTLSKLEVAYYVQNEIIPKQDKTVKLYRVVCDGFDRIVSFEQKQTVNVLAEIPNPFGYVPGEILSDIPGEEGETNDDSFECYQSPLHSVIELLSRYMFDRSVFQIAYNRIAYAKEWMHKFKCPTCDGKKVVDGAQCPECKGTGQLPHLRNEDAAIVDYAASINANVPTPPMGTVDAKIDGLTFMRENNIGLEETITYTLFGSIKAANTFKSGNDNSPGGNVSKTAYEANLNDQSRRDTLRRWSAWMASTMKWYADVTGKFIYGDAYISSAIVGGDRFMEESADATFARLDAARTGNAPKSILRSLFIEYLENKYQNNPIDYNRAFVQYIAEPFMWDSTKDVLTWPVAQSEKLKKIYFDEWLCSLTDDYYIDLPQDGMEAQVKADLDAYMLDRYQKSMQTDNLLFTGSGESIIAGSNVMVKKENALKPEHVGIVFKVKSVTGSNLILTDPSNNDIYGYTFNDVEKQTSRTLIQN